MAEKRPALKVNVNSLEGVKKELEKSLEVWTMISQMVLGVNSKCERIGAVLGSASASFWRMNLVALLGWINTLNYHKMSHIHESNHSCIQPFMYNPIRCIEPFMHLDFNAPSCIQPSYKKKTWTKLSANVYSAELNGIKTN